MRSPTSSDRPATGSGGRLAGRSRARRSLADDVRARSDAELGLLLTLRPDLALPPASDLTSLVARATTRASTQRALENLDRGRIQLLEALAASGDPVDAEEAAALLGADPEDLARRLPHLWDRALVWLGSDGWHVVRSVLEALGAWPAGLGPSIESLRGSAPAVFRDPAALAELVASAPPGARTVLDQLAWGPPVGTLAPGGPVEEAGRWLLRHQLVSVQSVDQVVLPREVALVLRGGLLHRPTELDPPDPPMTRPGPAAVDHTAGGAADQLLGLVDEVCVRFAEDPPRVLRAGGLAVRDLRALRVALDVPETQAAFLVELAYTAGILGDDGAVEPVWAPTPSYDDWVGRHPATRWARLALAWLRSGRAAWLVGTSGEAGAINALSREGLWPPGRDLREVVLTELAALPPGTAPTGPGILARVQWRRPLRRPDLTGRVVAATAQEAEWLGVTGRGGLGTAGRVLARPSGVEESDVAALAAAMRPHLPAPVEHLLLQADLTAVAPGRVEGDLARLLRLLTDVESRGGATVHRFAPASVRRGLDAGLTGEEILRRLDQVSTTGVPQPLEYLVRDAARRHGTTRVGSVSSYLRCDDEATLDAILAERKLAPLRLRRIAPTVLVSPVDSAMVIDLLRRSGLAPVAEGLDGAVVVPAAPGHRTPVRRPPVPPMRQPLTPERVEQLVAALRTGDLAREAGRAAADTGPRLPSTDPMVTLSLLREAAADRHRVWIGYADQDGRATRLLFQPLRLEGGRAYGTVDGSELERAFSVHRITGVAPAT